MEDKPEYTNPSETGTLRFNKNWNNKLQCQSFSTIRLNSERFKPGKVFRILLQYGDIFRDHCYARVFSVKPIRIHQISDAMAKLDSDLTADQMKDTLYFMYKDKVDLEKAEFAFIILEKIKSPEKQQTIFDQMQEKNLNSASKMH